MFFVKKQRSGWVWVLALLVMIAGCAPPSSGSSANQELVYASTADAVGLSPIMTNDSASSRVIDQIYETLFVRDPKTLKIKPKLAKSYENPDPNTWIIHLRKGIQFHDGTPFDAKAVEYTFDKLRDPDTGAPRASLLASVKEVEVKDADTVVLKTDKPYGPILAALTHTNAAIVSPSADKEQDLMKKPIGTGPFQLEKWVQGDRLTLVPNPDYWGDKPMLKKVTFRVVPEISTAISLLERGEVHLVDGLQPEHLDRLKNHDKIKLSKQKGTPITYLGFNMKKAPMKDHAFRQAIAYAIDEEAIIGAMNGLAYPSEGVIGPKVFGYDDSIEGKGYKHDPDRAKELAGQADIDQTVTITTANTGNYPMLAELIQGQLSKAGIKAKIKTLEWGAYLDTTRKGDIELMVGGWSNSTADGSELVYPNLHSDNVGSSNSTQTAIPEADELIIKSRTTTDENERLKALNEVNQLLVERAPWIPLYHEVVVTAMTENVQGLQVDPTGRWELAGVTLK